MVNLLAVAFSKALHHRLLQQGVEPVHILLAATLFKHTGCAHLLAKLEHQCPDLIDTVALQGRAAQRLRLLTGREGMQKMQHAAVLDLREVGFDLIVAVSFVDHDGIGQLDHPFFDSLQLITSSGDLQ